MSKKRWIKRIMLFVVVYVTGIQAHTLKQLSHEEKVSYYLQKELKTGYSHGDEAQALEMDRVYFEVLGEELRRYLKKEGFKFLNPNAYKDKVKKKLGLSEKAYLQKSSDETIDTPASPVGSNSIYLLPKQGIVSLPYKMPEIIDYKKVYPKLAAYEKNINAAYQKSTYTQQRVSWSRMNSNAKNNLKFTLALNKYLLNDDDTQLPWLVAHAYGTMLSIYKQGEKPNKKLLKALLEAYIKYKHKPMAGYETISLPTLDDLLLLPIKRDNGQYGKYTINKEAFEVLSTLIKEEESNIAQKQGVNSDTKLKNVYLEALKAFIASKKNAKGHQDVIVSITQFIKETPCNSN